MQSILENTDIKTIDETIKNGQYFDFLHFTVNRCYFNNKGINTSSTQMYYDGEKWKHCELIEPSVGRLYELLIDFYNTNNLEVFCNIVVIKKGNKYINIKQEKDNTYTINQDIAQTDDSVLAYSAKYNKCFFVSKNSRNTDYIYHELEYVNFDDLVLFMDETNERTNKKNVQ